LPHYFFDLTDNETVHDFKGKQLANIQTCAPTRHWNCLRTNKDEIGAFERTHFSLVGHGEGWKIPEAIFSACLGRGRVGIAVLIQSALNSSTGARPASRVRG
jgi:hypothetical protein